jgi:hypothetical protein
MKHVILIRHDPKVREVWASGERLIKRLSVVHNHQAGSVGVLGPETVHAEVVQLQILAAQVGCLEHSGQWT